MTPPLPELTAHLGYRLRQVSNHVSHGFARKLAGQGVTMAEWALLRVLHGRAPAPPSRVAAEMGLTRGAISKLADRLIGKGLLQRAADPADGRSQRIALTPRGAAILPELAALAERNEAECFDHLPAADHLALRRILEACISRLGLDSIPLD